MIFKKPLYPFLFIFFYLFNNFTAVKGLISIQYFVTIFFLCVFGCMFLSATSYAYYKSWKKSFLFSFFFLFFYLQYGTIHSGLVNIKGLYYLSKHSILVPIITIMIGCFFLLLKKHKLNNKIIVTLNIGYSFLFFFILIQFFYSRSLDKKAPFGLIAADWANTKLATGSKPDIFLIIYDEYASSLSLKRRFDFDNTVLDSFLSAQKFSIQKKSKSNYNQTNFSMLSFLNADYLQNFKSKKYYARDEEIQVQLDFSKTNLVNFLKNNNYNIHNFSIFPLSKTDGSQNGPIFSSHPLLLASAYYTLIDEMEPFLLKNNFLRYIFSYGLYNGKREMEQLEKNFYTQLNAPLPNNNSSFYYLHQLAPHWIFYYDKNGNDPDFKKILKTNAALEKAYVEYVQYCNKKIIKLINIIKQKSNNKAVIIFLGDHGFRHNLQANDKEYFANQNAVYFPDQDYHLLYDSISNVNITRILANKYFQLNLPLLKDSSIFIEKKLP